MSDLATVEGAGSALRELFPTGSVGERIRDAALALRWSHSRVRDVWYAQARHMLAVETDSLRAYVARRNRQSIRDLTHEHTELADRLARMEAMLAEVLATSKSGAVHSTRPMVRGESAPVGAGASAGNP